MAKMGIGKYSERRGGVCWSVPAPLYFLVRAGGEGTSSRTAAAAFKFCGRICGGFELFIQSFPDEKSTYADYRYYDKRVPHQYHLWGCS